MMSLDQTITSATDVATMLRTLADAKRDGLLDHPQAKNLVIEALRAAGFTSITPDDRIGRSR